MIQVRGEPLLVRVTVSEDSAAEASPEFFLNQLQGNNFTAEAACSLLGCSCLVFYCTLNNKLESS